MRSSRKSRSPKKENGPPKESVFEKRSVGLVQPVIPITVTAQALYPVLLHLSVLGAGQTISSTVLVAGRSWIRVFVGFVTDLVVVRSSLLTSAFGWLRSGFPVRLYRGVP